MAFTGRELWLARQDAGRGPCRCRLPRCPPQPAGPASGRGRERRPEPLVPGTRRAVSVTGCLTPRLLVATRFPASLSHGNISLHSQPPLHCFSGSTGSGFRFGQNFDSLDLSQLLAFTGAGFGVTLGKGALFGPFLSSPSFGSALCFSKHWGSCEWFGLSCLNSCRPYPPTPLANSG